MFCGHFLYNLQPFHDEAVCLFMECTEKHVTSLNKIKSDAALHTCKHFLCKGINELLNYRANNGPPLISGAHFKHDGGAHACWPSHSKCTCRLEALTACEPGCSPMSRI